MATKILQRVGSGAKASGLLQGVKSGGYGGVGGSRSSGSLKAGVMYTSDGKEKREYKLRPDQTPIHPQGRGMTATFGLGEAKVGHGKSPGAK